MPVIVVVGGQWGDEGKGRVGDLLAEKTHLVARYSAANNAGHTVVNELGEFKLHLVPAGIFYPDKVCLIGNGVVIDPAVLLGEIEDLESRGVSVRGRLFLSDRAQVLMPWHPLIDKESLLQQLSFLVPYKNAVLEKLYGVKPLTLDRVHAEYTDFGSRLAPFVTDTAELVEEAIARGDTVLLEGAQGALLDLDADTYEYVPSSFPSSLAGGAAIGMGIGPTKIDFVLGVYKAYNTRVGNGPMPTELLDETGDLLREGGPRPEYGATTGRPRRCGWFDAVAARYTARIHGETAIALTRLDVLDQLPTLKMCTAYRLDGGMTDSLPASGAALARAKPVYEELPGWQKDTSGVRRFQDLPENARAYVRRIEETMGAPAHLLSVGPEREQAIPIKPIL